MLGMIRFYRLFMFYAHALYNYAILYGCIWVLTKIDLVIFWTNSTLDNVEIAFITLVLQAVGFMIVSSPVGHFLMESCEPFRKLSKRESNKLAPLLDEILAVYNNNKDCHLTGDIKLYMKDDEAINAHAYGRNKIAFTTGFLDKFKDREVIKGVMAHELAHLHYKDILSHYRAGATGGIFLVIIGISFGIIRFLTFVADIIPLLYLIVTPIQMVFGFLGMIYSVKDLPMEILEKLSVFLSQKIEYRADKFAARLVGNKGMIRFFEDIKRKEKITGRGLFLMQRQSHPPSELRIDCLIT